MTPPIPNRVLLHVPGNSRVSVLRKMSYHASTDLELHVVGLYESLTAKEQDMIETPLIPGVLMFDGCMAGVNAPYIMMVRPLYPVAMDNPRSSHPVSMIFWVLSPDTDHSGHVQRINRLTRFLKQPGSILHLQSAQTIDDAMALFMTESPSVRAA
jgi:mannitol/fructose-specific phosphotransferase system IIA component (Ntr-type)